MPFTRSVSVGLLWVAACGAPAVSALAAEASATMDQFRFQVRDLDLTDGVDAGYRLHESRTVLDGSLRRPDDFNGGPVPGSGQPFFQTATWEQTWRLEAGTAARAAVGNGWLSSSGTSGDQQGEFWAGSTITTPASYSGNFLLAPHSELTISIDYTLWTQVSGGRSADGTTETAGARVEASVEHGHWSSPTTLAADAQEIGLPRAPVALGSFDDLRANGRLLLTITNTDEWENLYSLELRTSAWGQGIDVAAAVPEPDTWALSVAGLLAIGVNARRAKTRAGARRRIKRACRPSAHGPCPSAHTTA
ncbi:PEP-CTERM sorting domain-containing protein [Caldimonas brevitalea]|uniref:PEP-CTERM protein-sorting domain-containing protein n=1 Tax=Caldimonas brevitalea TaxID=413882 RepID=A0A0G3BMI5_9BURK|nr:PEP-CTERM sorting domain-containing protein [Caldimonas brevitalea]AKJ28571.1 hypothetical protein AAW51_1880 [Caldimonas brevitalea]